MSKTFSEAYSLGQADGETGENKLPSRALTRTFTHIGSYLPGAENRDSEWVRGYKQGFEDKVRTINVASTEGSKMQSNLNQSVENFPSPAGLGAGGGGDPRNDFRYRIHVAKNLYEQMRSFSMFLTQTGDDFAMLMNGHALLEANFFNDLMTYHIRPRVSQIANLKGDVGSFDLPALQNLVMRYEQAIHGMTGGTASANQYFNAINLSSAHKLSEVSVAMGNGDPRDYDTQLAVAYSIRHVFEALLAQINASATELDACTKSHDQLMTQDFATFIQNNIEPRLHSLTNLWRAVNDKDIPGIDDVISRLRTVASM